VALDVRLAYQNDPIVKAAPATSQDLYQRLAQGMGPDLHWFPQDVPLSQLAATLAAMANTMGGTVLLGIAPRSGQVHGVRDPEEAIDRIFQAALMADPPLVLPIPRVQSVQGDRVLWITIPAGLPNVYNIEGRYLWREGVRTNPIPALRLRQLLVERGALQFESRLPTSATLDDLDPKQVDAYVSALNLPGVESPDKKLRILLQRGCLQSDHDTLRPTYAALLLFGRHPQRWLPSASILAARFSGVSFGDRFVKQEIAGSLPEQLRQAEVFANDNLRRVVRLVGLAHQETLEYPFEAVRELLVNAVAHRDYNLQGDSIHLNIFSDRLEVSSPGGLPGPVTLQNLLEARYSRNPVIVQVLSDLGFVERLGYGLDRVVRLMRQTGLREPRFEEVAGNFRVTLFRELSLQRPEPDLSQYLDLNLNPRQEMALSHLAQHKRITNRDYQELSPDVHPETLRRDLADLVSKGVLLKIGDKKATYYILK
jgi:ATP-dependent DNA helicase RecG